MTDIIIGSTAVERFTEFVEGAPVASTPGSGDFFPIIQGGVTKKISATQASGQIPITTVSAGASYAVADGDRYIVIDKTVPGVIAIQLPTIPTEGRKIDIADGAGNAHSFNITINGNGRNIDGGSTFVMQYDWQAVTLVYTGLIWKIS
jgi:hypothetical protein